MSKKVKGGFALSLLFVLASAGLVGCGNNQQSTTSSKNSESSISVSSDDTVKVNEVNLTLSKNNAKVGELVEAKVVIKPNNATNKDYTLISSNEEIAKIEEGKIRCVSAGNVTITARSNDNPNKKSIALLNVLGTDDQGRVENIFEAEEANLVGETIKAEITSDERVSNDAQVACLSKGDRMIWGINSSDDDDNAILKVRMMGPSGWLGYWDSIPFNFADWYTVKVNGKNVDTEDVYVEGTYNQGGYADYCNHQNITLGNIKLKKGLNVITIVLSNRFDTYSIADSKYNGNINCTGNFDSISIFSSKDLTYVPKTEEVTNADPDVLYKTKKMEVEAATTRVYLNDDNNHVDMTGKTSAEFVAGESIFYGVTSSRNTGAKLVLNVACPFENEETAAHDVNAGDFLNLVVNEHFISLKDCTILGNNKVNDKANYTAIETPWFDVAEGNNEIELSVKANPNYAYLGALDYIEVKSFKGEYAPYFVETVSKKQTFRFEAEAKETKLVDLDKPAEGATYVELKPDFRVQTETYNAKWNSPKVIYGVESSKETVAKVTMRMSSPYVDGNTQIEDVGVGSLGDLWVNGKIISTPNVIKGTNTKAIKDNFSVLEIEAEIELHKGKNRVVWEPSNYTANNYSFFGAMDYIELETVATLNAYEVNFWTDRNTYFDDDNGEPIYVTCDHVANGSSWFGLYTRDEDPTKANDGSLTWEYPDMTDGVATFDISKCHPHSTRPGISHETGGYYKVCYFENDAQNDQGGYDLTDVVYISLWDDPDVYGGRI